MTRAIPVRKAKNGDHANFYEAKTSCGSLKIYITDGEDSYPVRITIQSVGGGCEANLAVIQRLITLLLEMNCRADIITEQLNKVVCSACKTKLTKGDKEISLSCGKAVADAITGHINKKETKA
jgi:hypothetical protein